MTERKSKFDIREHGRWAELRNTVKFTFFVLLTCVMWLGYGALVRRAYKKACAEGREYCVDHMPSGRRPQ